MFKLYKTGNRVFKEESWLNYIKQDMGIQRRELVKLLNYMKQFYQGLVFLVVLDVVCGNVLLFLLDIKIDNR